MDYSSYIKEAFDIAKDHGFHDVELPVNHFIMLIITEISEMADACIRIFDLAGVFGWKLSDAKSEEVGYRAYCYVSQRKFTEIAYTLCNMLTSNGPDSHNEQKCTAALSFMESWAKDLHLDLAWHIEQNMKYNKTRARLNGKQY